METSPFRPKPDDPNLVPGSMVPEMTNTLSDEPRHDALGDELRHDDLELHRQANARRHSGLLDKALADLPDLSQALEAMKRSSRDKLYNAVFDPLLKVMSGYFCVPDFSEKQRARQDTLTYCGTHWTAIAHQEVLDWVRTALRRIGLQEDQVRKHDFVLNLTRDLLFNLSKAFTPKTIAGGALLNLQNGTLCIRPEDGGTFNIRLEPHRRDDFLTYVLPYAYDPQATCPLWDTFLRQVLPDPDAQRTLGEYMAYCFTPSVKAEKMLMLYGSGSNGKSVVLDVAEHILGTENVSNIALSSLTQDPESRAHIEGRLLNISTESNRDLDSAMFKALVSNEPVQIRVLYHGTRVMRTYARLMAAANVLPMAENSDAFFRRFIILPFGCVISEEQADTKLAEKLRGELPGILNWVLATLPAFIARGKFETGTTAREALAQYRHDADSVAQWLDERTRPSSVPTGGQLLYNDYKAFCIDIGRKPVRRSAFYEQLMNKGKKRSIYHNHVTFEVALSSDSQPPAVSG